MVGSEGNGEFGLGLVPEGRTEDISRISGAEGHLGIYSSLTRGHRLEYYLLQDLILTFHFIIKSKSQVSERSLFRPANLLFPGRGIRDGCCLHSLYVVCVASSSVPEFSSTQRKLCKYCSITDLQGCGESREAVL